MIFTSLIFQAQSWIKVRISFFYIFFEEIDQFYQL